MTEYRLVATGDKVTLAELLPGTIFLCGDDCLAVKSEYQCSNGLIEAFIIGSGEQFWGGTHTVREQRELIVQPMAVVEVFRGRWIHCHGKTNLWYCSVCGGKIIYNPKRRTYNISKLPTHEMNRYCRCCGSKMDMEVYE